MRKIKKKSTRSCKTISKNQRKTLFKKSHKFYPPYSNSQYISGGISDDSGSFDGYCKVHSQSVSTVTRLSASVAADVMNATGSTHSDVTVPFKLRPTAPEKGSAPAKERKPSNINDKEVKNNENIIVNLDNLKGAFQAVSQHVCPKPDITLSRADRKGLLVEIEVACKNCDFHTGLIPMTDPTSILKSSMINISVLLPVLLSKIGINDLQLVLAALNIQAPDSRGMQRKLNELADEVEKLAREQLTKNQMYVKEIEELSGKPDGIELEFDVSYTSRPQAGTDTASQCFAPIIEKTTTQHLPVDIQIGNKLCSSKSCDHKSNKCKKNFDSDTGITNAEKLLLKKSIQAVEKANIIKVNSVTTDGSQQITKVMRDINSQRKNKIKHYQCFVHTMRNFHRQLKNVKIKAPNGQKRKIFTMKLASSLRIRIRLELKRLRSIYKNTDSYIQKARNAICNILECFHGNHALCRQKSVVCTAHLKRKFNMSYLPYGKYLKLSSTDRSTVMTVIEKYCSSEQLKKSEKLYTTNASENMHSRLFSYAPKSTVWRRNFPGLCHAVTLGASIGRGKSLLHIVQHLGMPVHNHDPLFKYASKAERVAIYHRNRKRTYRYKSSRYAMRRKNSHRAILENSLYRSRSTASAEHGYAIDLGQ